MDSNVLIYHLEKIPPYSELTLLLIEFIQKGQISGHTSALSFLELNVRPYQKGETNLAANYTTLFKRLPHFSIHPLTLEMADMAARLRAKYKLKTPDAIHVASALACQAQVLLGNDREFKKIKEISYLHLDDFVK